MTFEVLKLKGLSEQVRNDYIKGAEERLEARLVQEAAERARREVEERVIAKAAAEEQAEKVTAAKVETEGVVRKTVEEITESFEVALTRGESSTSNIAPLVLKTLEELRK